MAKIKNKKTGEIREVSDKELKQYGLGGKLPKAKLGKDVDPFMQNAIGNRINYWEERNANGELPQQINLGNVGGQSNLPKFVAQDYGDIDESQFGQQNPNYTENPFLTQEIVKEPDYKNSVQLNKQIQDYRNPKPNITFKKPEMNMLPTMGNKYFQRGMQYLNQSIDHASAIGTDPNSWEQPLDYYNGISNSPFSSTKVDKKYTTLRPKQDTYTLPTEDVQLPETQQSLTPKLTKFGDGGKNKDKQYLEWKEKLPKNLQYEGNYDLRGFYNENPNFNPSNPNQHLTDKFKLPNHPTFSNESKYFNMVQPQILNQAGHWDKTDSSYNYIPYNPMYKDTVIEKFGDGGMNQNQFNNLQALGTGVNATQSGINFGKGTLDMIGSMNQNNQVQNMENQLYTQSVFSGNIDNRPMEQYGYNWSGRNALAENGMQIKEIGGQGTPSVEVEGNEHIKLPNGFSQEIKGKSHSEGGIPLNLPLDSKVFSEKLKIETPKGKKSYADLAKKFETKKNFDMLDSKYADGIQKSTADMMIKFKNQQLENLFEMQEQNKMQGLHGQDAQMETMQDYTPEAKYGIHIKPENRGKFNATKKRTGKTTEELTHSKNPITKKRAVFAQNASHWNKKEMGGNIIKDNLVNYNGDFYNQDIIDGLDRNERIDQTNWNKNLNRYGVTNNEEFYRKFPTEEQFMFRNGIDKGRHMGMDRYVGEEVQMSKGGKTKRDFQQMYNNNQNVQDFVLNPTYTPEGLQIINPELNLSQDGRIAPQSTFTGVNKNADFKTLRLSENKKKRRNNFLPFNSTNTPDVYGDPAYRESVFKDFEDRTGIKLNRANSDAVNLEAIRKYQNARTPELTKDYKLNFTRGNQDLYNEFTKQKGYKKSPDEVKESNKFYDWAVANNKLNADYTDKGKWGHEYYNTAPLNFDTEAEYNKWKQDPDWEQVGKYFVDRSGDPNGMITYYDVHKNWKNPVTKKGETTPTVNQTEKIIDRQPEYNINPNMDIQFPLPNVYSRTPLNYYQIDPSYIDPRYLDIQPQLNEISRGQRAFQNNLGSRGTTDIANLLQSQANGYNAQQQAFGNKYNYDRGQDATAQQFNAQAKMNTDQYNQQSWFNQLENPIRQRESNIGDQELTDMYRGQERADQAIQFKNTKNYIDDTYSQYQNMSPEEWSARMEFLSKFKPKDSEKKYGGKIKPKLKKKSVNNR